MQHSKMTFEQAVNAELEHIIASEATQTNCTQANSTVPQKREQTFTASVAPSGTPQIWSLASGSRANSIFLTDGKTSLLIDCGLSCRMLNAHLKSIGFSLSDIDAAFITHEHSDHTAGLPTLLKNHSIPVHMTEPSYIAFTRSKGFEYREKIIAHPTEYTETVGTLTVTSCPVSHDAAACVSYLVEGDELSFCTCTDLGMMTDEVIAHASKATSLILESNHDPALLRSGSYPDELKRRIRSDRGHLSNYDCSSALVTLVKNGVQRVLLGHISPENNTPELALHCAIEALERADLTVELLDAAPRMSVKRIL